MKKTELVVAMADELNMSKLQTTSVLKTILETMTTPKRLLFDDSSAMH